MPIFLPAAKRPRLAKTLAGVIGGDLFEIRPQTAYTAADLDWNNAKSRSSVEMNDPKSRPAMAETPRLAGYDTVFVGFPIWWYQAPPHHPDFSGERRFLRQDRDSLRYLRRQRHG